MNEPTHTEAVQTDLPSPKPNRRKRLALRFTVLVVAVSVLGAAYWFTRPPELVWWKSGKVLHQKRLVRLMIPNGWGLDARVTNAFDDQHHSFSICPVDRRPRLVQWIFPRRSEAGRLNVNVYKQELRRPINDAISLVDGGPEQGASRRVASKDGWIVAELDYERTNLPAFNRTYRQICNSLRIE